jgi:hypothetical protein
LQCQTMTNGINLRNRESFTSINNFNL